MRPAPSNEIALRIEAIKAPCERLIDGKPGLLINRNGCPRLRRGLLGGWHYKRVQVSNEERYHDTPNKNDYSHPCDALGYGLMSAGEGRRLRGKDQAGKRKTTVAAMGEFNV